MRIAVIGSGYVTGNRGMPRQHGHDVVCTDNDEAKICLLELLDSACDHRENLVRMGADELNRGNRDRQNHAEHHSVFGDVLAFLG